MRAQDFACGLLGNQLNNAAVRTHDHGLAVAGDVEGADFNIVARFFCLIRGHTDIGDLRGGVDASRNDIVVHNCGSASAVCSGDHALSCGDVRQLNFSCDIADGVNVFHAGLHAGIDFDKRAVHLDAQLLQADTRRHCPAANAHNANTARSNFVFAVQFVVDIDAIATFDARNFGIIDDGDTFSLEAGFDRVYDVRIDARQDRGHHLDYRNLFSRGKRTEW